MMIGISFFLHFQTSFHHYLQLKYCIPCSSPCSESIRAVTQLCSTIGAIMFLIRFKTVLVVRLSISLIVLLSSYFTSIDDGMERNGNVILKVWRKFHIVVHCLD